MRYTIQEKIRETGGLICTPGDISGTGNSISACTGYTDNIRILLFRLPVHFLQRNQIHLTLFFQQFQFCCEAGF